VKNLFNLQVGEALESLTIPNVSADRVKRYAEVSNDFNPIHLDEKVAKKAGFDQQIVHGMLTMSYASRLLSPYLNADLLVHPMIVTFRAPLLVGEGVEINGEVKEKSSDQIKVEISGMSGNGNQVLRGEIVIRNRKQH
jgi:3-hydroxybutyryl-CoA dehydratase